MRRWSNGYDNGLPSRLSGFESRPAHLFIICHHTSKMNKKQEFTKRMLVTIAPLAGISVVLIARNKTPELLLFFIGIAGGIFVWKAYTKK